MKRDPKILTETDMKAIVESANEFPEALLNLYKFAFPEPEWSNIENIEGFPILSNHTAEVFIGMWAKQFPNFSSNIMMMWANNGFSCRDYAEDFRIYYDELELVLKS